MPLRPQNGINAGGQRVTNGADPTAATDLATKQYVDARTMGGIVALAADVSNANATANTLAIALTFTPTVLGTYLVRATLHYTAAATTTGSRWVLTGPTASAIRARSIYSLTSTSQTVNEGISAYSTPASCSSSSASTAANIAVIEGFLTITALGAIAVAFASGVASSAITAKAGSMLEWRQVA